MTGPGPKPRNRTAKQLLHRADGNPPSTLPDSAPANCYPGVELDLRNLWRRIFAGIELHEASGYVVRIEDPALGSLLRCRLLAIDGHAVTTVLRGPRTPGGPTVELATPANPDAAAFLEWSNSLSRVLDRAGARIPCVFTAAPSDVARRPDWPDTQTVELELRHPFEAGAPVLARELAEPGELTQSLCAPWQHDFRECACYYWAASRPDFVDVEAGPDGLAAGLNWMDRRADAGADAGAGADADAPGAPVAAREYLPDPRPRAPTDPIWITYDELFQRWQELLRFVIGGRRGS